jgi:hypothetical protein
MLEVVSSAAPEAPHRGCGPPTKFLTDQMRRKVARLPTDEDRATAERPRKAAWARTQRQTGLLKETAESLRERQRRRRARLKANSEARR